MPAPYWSSPDGDVTLYLGDMREVLPALGLQADLVLADPPYSETSLAWDRWPDGWPTLAASVASSMWCFGSMRMFLDRTSEFADWKLSQDVIGLDGDGQAIHGDVNVVWEKPSGTGFAADRFKRVHEHALHWYRGSWGALHRDVPRIPAADPTDQYRRIPRASNRAAHTGQIAGGERTPQDGTRLMRSVIHAKSVAPRQRIHSTEKPVDLLRPLIRYACPPAGLVLDPFAGSGSTLDAARQSGRRAIGVEANEAYCEAAARRLSQLTLEAS